MMNNKIQLVEIKNMPKPDAGATMPLILADDVNLILFYRTDDAENSNVAMVKFKFALVHKFGNPNDETLSGHPLYKFGLSHYSVYEIKNSPWIKEVEKINSVHPRHNSKIFKNELNHYIFTFHDNTFECIAESYSVEIVDSNSLSVLKEIIEKN